jgi:ParB family chromosome partitioning protein
MSTTTAHPATHTDKAQFLAPETHQRAEGQDDSGATLRYIPLAKLVPSPLNVRKAGGVDIDELAMLIDSQGLLQNLIVVEHLSKQKPTGRFEVIAGGRRLRALRKLADVGNISKTEEILCQVTTRDKALAVSIAENSGREALSVPDTVLAFRDMVVAGASVEDVAVSFGITPLTVKRRLKLANVSPRLFEGFRAGDVTLDQMMTLALTDDHAAQERVWDALDDYDRHPRNLRRYLLGREIDAARDPVAIFVGLAAYEAAGGAVTKDLFAQDDEEAGYIADAELLHRLAKEKLDAEAATLGKEGWKWAEARVTFDYAERHAFGQAPMGMREATTKEQAKLDAFDTAQNEAEASLEALYDGDEDSFDQKKADELERKSEKAQRDRDALHEKMRQYAPEILACAGVVVTIEHGGRLSVIRGLVRPEDRKEVAKAAKASKERGSDDDEGGGEGGIGAKASNLKAAGVSESLQRKLTAHRTIALQALLMDNAHVALAAVVGAMVHGVCSQGYMPSESALSIRATGCDHDLKLAADDMEASPAHGEVQARLDLWMDRIPGDADRVFPWLLGQDDSALLDLLALCAARTLNGITTKATSTGADAIASAVGLDMADWWSATSVSYLAQVPKAQIVEAVSEAISAEAGAALAKLKKGEAVAKAEAQLAGMRWLPTALRAR